MAFKASQGESTKPSALTLKLSVLYAVFTAPPHTNSCHHVRDRLEWPRNNSTDSMLATSYHLTSVIANSTVDPPKINYSHVCLYCGVYIAPCMEVSNQYLLHAKIYVICIEIALFSSLEALDWLLSELILSLLQLFHDYS